MKEKKESPITALPFSPQELIEEILPELNTHLPISLCASLRIIPFLPLTESTVEKIMRSRLSVLNHSLYNDHNLHLNYAPEVLNYLAKNAWKQQKADHYGWEIDNILEKLHATIEQAIEHQPNTSHSHRRLLLQLNETGTLLRCEWSREKIRI